jgi:hypothetical protein
MRPLEFGADAVRTAQATTGEDDVVPVSVVVARPTGEPKPGRVRNAAVLAHGAGSTAEFVLRAFTEPLRAVGLTAVSWDQRRGTARLADHLADLAEVVNRTAARVVGGVSFGAHLAAAWAVDRDLDGVLLAMPAWTGPPDGVAGLSALAADAVAGTGLGTVLARTAIENPGWVADELAAAWPRYGAADLVTALSAVAHFPGPTLADLSQLTAPAGVVALRGDPFHPATVAAQWAAALPTASVVELSPAAPGADRRAIGRAAVLGWLQAGGRPAGAPAATAGSLSEPR